MPSIAALVVAAGSGSRAGQDRPKQYVSVAGRPLLRYSLEAFLKHPRIDMVQVVIGVGQEALFEKATAGLPLAPPVPGGATRQQSVHAGLEALAKKGTSAPELVLIHDAARPFLPAALIEALIEALSEHAGVIPALPVVDTIKRVDERGIIVETPPREMLRAAQTPQAFRFADILAAHRAAANIGAAFSDDAAVAEHAGLEVAVIEGAAQLRKVTHAEDFDWAADMARKLGLAT